MIDPTQMLSNWQTIGIIVGAYITHFVVFSLIDMYL